MKPKYAVPIVVFLVLAGLISLQGAMAASQQTCTQDQANAGLCWEKVLAEWRWYGPQDGSSNVFQGDAVVLEEVRSGVPARWQVTLPGQVNFCIGTITVTVVTGTFAIIRDGTCAISEVPPGVMRLTESIGPVGGAGWEPQDGYGWRAPLVVINKSVVNDDGGTTSASDFTLFVGQITMTNGVARPINIGLYEVHEVGPTSYTASFTGRCSSLGVMQVVTGTLNECTITNNDVPMSSTQYLPIVAKAPPDLGPCDPPTGNCWRWDTGEWVWTGPVDGSFMIWQGHQVVLDSIRAGTPSHFGPVPVGRLEICVGNITVTLANGDTIGFLADGTCMVLNLPAGVVRVTNSTGPVGGYGWTKAP